MVNPDGPPMSGSQSRAKGSSIALVLPVEYSTASWRRALLSLGARRIVGLPARFLFDRDGSLSTFDQLARSLAGPVGEA